MIYIKELFSAISNLDQRCVLAPSRKLLKHSLNSQAESDLISMAEAERLLLHLQGTSYEHGCRLLAHQLKRQAATRLIPPNKSDNQSTILEGLKSPAISYNWAEHLETSLSINEITQSILVMQTNKAPGRVGFPIEFYKKFSN